MKEKRVFTTILGIIVLLLAVIGATFAYFYADAQIEEQNLSVHAVNPTGLIYDGVGLLSLNNAIPGDRTSVKTFTIENPSSSPVNQVYSLSLHIDANEFTKNHIQNLNNPDDTPDNPNAVNQLLMYIGYGDCEVDESENNPLSCDSIIELDLTDGISSSQSGVDIPLYEALIEPEEVQEYYVYLKFNDNNLNQDENRNKSFGAHIELSDSVLLKDAALPYDELDLSNKIKRLSSSTNNVSYTELEYIESNGTQWIDTGYIFQSLKQKVEFNFTPAKIEDARVCGSYINDGSYNHCGLIIQPRQSYMAEVGNRSVTPNFSMTAGVNYDVLLEGDNGSITFRLGNNTYSSSYIASTILTGKTYYIFNTHWDDPQAEYLTKASMKLYYFKMYDNDVLVRDFIPVKDSNGVACLYDKVTNQYFYNAANSLFIAGPNKYIPSNSTYTEIEYIEGMGTQYIDTGVKENEVYGFEYRFMPTTLNTEFQSYLSGTLDVFTIGAATGISNSYLRHRGSEITWAAPLLTNAVNVVTLSNNTYSINGSTYYTSTSSPVATTNKNIFILNNAGDTRTASARVYSLKLYDGYGNLIRDFIPVKDSNNVICLYDKITSDFYYNSGMGEFNIQYIEEINPSPANGDYDYGDGSLNKTIGGYNNKVYINGVQARDGIDVTENYNYGNYYIALKERNNKNHFILEPVFKKSLVHVENPKVLVTSGTNLYSVPFDATDEEMTCYVIIYAGGGTSSIQIGNLAFKADGTLMTLREMVDAEIIKPLVLMSSSAQSSYYTFQDVLGLYDSKTYITNSTSYPNMHILFMLNPGHIITDLQLYSSRNFNTTYDGLGYAVTPTKFARLTLNPFN